MVVALNGGWPRVAPWRRRFGTHSPVSVAAGTAGRNVWGPWAAPLGPGRFGLARPNPAGPRPFPALPASSVGAGRVEKRWGKIQGTKTPNLLRLGAVPNILTSGFNLITFLRLHIFVFRDLRVGCCDELRR